MKYCLNWPPQGDTWILIISEKSILSEALGFTLLIFHSLTLVSSAACLLPVNKPPEG